MATPKPAPAPKPALKPVAAAPKPAAPAPKPVAAAPKPVAAAPKPVAAATKPAPAPKPVAAAPAPVAAPPAPAAEQTTEATTTEAPAAEGTTEAKKAKRVDSGWMKAAHTPFENNEQKYIVNVLTKDEAGNIVPPPSKRPGKKPYERFLKYVDGALLSDILAQEGGPTRLDVIWDEQHGYIQLVATA